MVATMSYSNLMATEIVSEDDGDIREQAARLEETMPAIARRLFTIDSAHPLADMPVAQLKLCALLLSQDSPTMSQVAEELRISVSAVTQLADRLERSGMVERISAADVPGAGERDRRSRHLRLTDRGRELMLSRRELRQCGARDALRKLAPADRRKVLEGLELLEVASRHVREAAGTGPGLADAASPENLAHLEWQILSHHPSSGAASGE